MTTEPYAGGPMSVMDAALSLLAECDDLEATCACQDGTTREQKTG